MPGTCAKNSRSIFSWLHPGSSACFPCVPGGRIHSKDFVASLCISSPPTTDEPPRPSSAGLRAAFLNSALEWMPSSIGALTGTLGGSGYQRKHSRGRRSLPREAVSLNLCKRLRDLAREIRGDTTWKGSPNNGRSPDKETGRGLQGILPPDSKMYFFFFFFPYFSVAHVETELTMAGYVSHHGGVSSLPC